MVVVSPTVDIHLSHTEELAEVVQTLGAARALCNHELVRDLVPGLVAHSADAIWLSRKAN